ncbi:MAG: hypothetical protein IAG10_13870, partial [Planctomycetaceae bacterium]|nr:hypothetical protein [Planctomycetaceae bacterium]
SRLAVFYIVIVRGLLIGAIAGLVTYPLAQGLAWGLTTFAAPCIVQPQDLYWLFAGSMVACFVGSLGPAVVATCSEPGDVLNSASLS